MGWSMGGVASLQIPGLLRDPVNFTTWCAQHPELKTFDCAFPPDLGHWELTPSPPIVLKWDCKMRLTVAMSPFGDERIHAALALSPCFFR